MLHPFLQISFSRKTLERRYLLNEPLYVRKISSFRSSQVCLTTLSMKLATSARLPADTDNAHLHHHGCTVIFLLDESLHDLPIQWKSQTDLSRAQAALSFLYASLLILTTLDKRTGMAGKWFVANVSLPTIDIRRIFTDFFFLILNSFIFIFLL